MVCADFYDRSNNVNLNVSEDGFISLYYDRVNNYLIEEDGFIFYDVHSIISPFRYDYMINVGGGEYIRKHGVIYEIIFPIGDEDDE